MISAPQTLFPVRTIASVATVAVLLTLGACATSKVDAEWTDPALRGQAMSLRGTNVLVACEAPDVAVRNICQDRLAAEVRARGATPVFVAPDTVLTRDRSLDQQLLGSAAKVNARAVLVVSADAGGERAGRSVRVVRHRRVRSRQQQCGRWRTRCHDARRRRSRRDGICGQRPPHGSRDGPAGLDRQSRRPAVEGSRRAVRHACRWRCSTRRRAPASSRAVRGRESVTRVRPPARSCRPAPSARRSRTPCARSAPRRGCLAG